MICLLFKILSKSCFPLFSIRNKCMMYCEFTNNMTEMTTVYFILPSKETFLIHFKSATQDPNVQCNFHFRELGLCCFLLTCYFIECDQLINQCFGTDLIYNIFYKIPRRLMLKLFKKNQFQILKGKVFLFFFGLLLVIFMYLVIYIYMQV